MLTFNSEPPMAFLWKRVTQLSRRTDVRPLSALQVDPETLKASIFLLLSWKATYGRSFSTGFSPHTQRLRRTKHDGLPGPGDLREGLCPSPCRQPSTVYRTSGPREIECGYRKKRVEVQILIHKSQSCFQSSVSYEVLVLSPIHLTELKVNCNR